MGSIGLLFSRRHTGSKHACVPLSYSLDGEVAMKNLEAAQVKMEEKLNSMTNFIDQELSKAKDSPVSSGYSKKRRKRSAQENPLRSISMDNVNDIMASIKSLDHAFSNLQQAYEEYKNSQTSSPDGQQPEDNADGADAEGVDADGADTQGADNEGVDTDGAEDGEEIVKEDVAEAEGGGDEPSEAARRRHRRMRRR